MVPRTVAGSSPDCAGCVVAGGRVEEGRGSRQPRVQRDAARARQGAEYVREGRGTPDNGHTCSDKPGQVHMPERTKRFDWLLYLYLYLQMTPRIQIEIQIWRCIYRFPLPLDVRNADLEIQIQIARTVRRPLSGR